MQAALPYAVSVHGFIDKIGSYLGFAAIIGVALLVIMFFVQARETSLLRERAEDAEEDLERLRQYAEQVGRQAAAAAARPAAPAAASVPAQARTTPAPAAAARAVPAPAAAASARRSYPVAPAGVGGPALSSATRLIPLSGPAAPAPAPSTVAAGAHATPAAVPPPSLPVTTSATSVDPGPPTPPPLSASAPAAASSSPRAPRRDYGRESESESRVGRGGLVVAAILVAVIVVAAVLVITHHSSHRTTAAAAHVSSTRSQSSTKSAQTGKSATVHVDPTQVRVAVLNGTATNNLAADVSAKLNKVGFQQGQTANYTDHTQTATTVGYLPGDRAQALAVAKALNVDQGSVQQVSAAARQLVCPAGASACADQVIVTLGANLNSDAS